MIDLASLAAASSEFASSVGIPSDEAVKIFLDQFPLPVMISALQSASEVPGLESSLVLCLEKILKTQYGLSLLPQCLPYAQAGLNSTSPLSRRLACRAISQLLENDSSGDGAVRTISELDLWPSLLSCIADTDEGVATVASDAVKNLAKSPSGLELICPTKLGNVSLLKRFADNSSSMVRIRILSLLSALFGISDEAASAIYRGGLLGLFEKELNRTDDILATLNALELLYEISLTANAGRSLVTKNLLKKLGSMISSSDTDPLLRSKAMSTTARLLSFDTVYSTVSKADINDAIQAIDMNLETLGKADNEKEVGIDALGLIGSVCEGRIKFSDGHISGRETIHLDDPTPAVFWFHDHPHQASLRNRNKNNSASSIQVCVCHCMAAPFALYFERKRSKLTFAVLLYVFFLGLIGIAMTLNVYYAGLRLSTPTIAATFVNLIPTLTFVMAILFKMEKINIRERSGFAKILGSMIFIGRAMVMTFYEGSTLYHSSRHIYTPIAYSPSPAPSSAPLTVHHNTKEFLIGFMLILAPLCWATFYPTISSTEEVPRTVDTHDLDIVDG